MFFVKLEFCEKVYLHPYQRKLLNEIVIATFNKIIPQKGLVNFFTVRNIGLDL